MEDSVFNHSRSGLAESVIDAIEIITDQKLNSAKFDRTIQATILSYTSNTKGEYICRYQDSKFLAYAPNPDVIYSENALVYVLIPGNDWDATKTIIGTVDKLGVDYIATISNKDYFDPIGNNVIEGIYNPIVLNTWEQTSKILYDKENNINIIGLNITKVAEYFKNESATNFYIQADIKSDIEPSQKLGHYGIKIVTNLASKPDILREYYFLSDNMEGEPRHFINYSTQNNLKAPFVINKTLVDNIEVNDFGEILSIEAIAENYTIEAGHVPDIYIKNIQLIALNRLTEMNMTDGYLSIITPLGSIFYLSGNNQVIPSALQLQAKIRMNGIVAEDNDVKYYWFRQDSRVYGGTDSLFEQYYCPLAGVNNNGWACLNNSHTEGDIRVWDTATKEWTISYRDLSAKQLTYKCVAIYDNLTLEKEIIIKNYAAEYDITITSDEGFSFSQDQGQTILRCNIQPIPSQAYSYYWASISSEGIFTTYPWFDHSTIIEAKTINKYTKFYCTIYTLNQFIGTATVTLVNSDKTAVGTYNLTITNGSQIFKYNAEGFSPTSSVNSEPQIIQKLMVEFSDLQGNQLSREDVLRSTEIKWFFPKEDSMIIPPELPDYTPENDYIDPTTGIAYIVYKDFYDMPFEIQDYFDTRLQQNQIRLSVAYNGIVYLSKTNFLFTKDGALGTNGTKYTCQIIPNTNSQFNYSRVFIFEPFQGSTDYRFNFIPRDDEFPFRVNVWKGTEQLFSGWESQEQSGIQFDIKWEICDGNNQSFYEIDPPNFIYKGLPNQIPNDGSFNNILKVSVKPRVSDSKTIYSFLPIGVVKILREDLSDYSICLYENNGLYSGFTYSIYNADGENPIYDEKNNNPFRIAIYDEHGIDITNEHLPVQSIIGTDLIYENPDWEPSEEDPASDYIVTPNQHIIPKDYYSGLRVDNAVLYTRENEYIIYAPIIFMFNRYGLGSLNDWDGTHITMDLENGDYIYAPQMGAGEKHSDNTFTGVLMGKVKLGQSEPKTGLMAYSHNRRTVFIDANTGQAEFGAGLGRIVLDPDNTGSEACIYGGNYNPARPTEGMCINLGQPSIKWGNGNFEVDQDGMIRALNLELKRPYTNKIYYAINPYGMVLDVGLSGNYDYPEDFPSAAHKKILLFNSDLDPTNSQMKTPTNAVAEFGDDGIVLQALHARSYLRMKNSDDDQTADKGPNVALKSGNALYLTSGIAVDAQGHPIEPTDTGEDYVSNASVNLKAAYNANIWAGHGVTLHVTRPHEKDNGLHPNYPDMMWDDSYGYLKMETEYGWLYMSSKAGGKENTPGIGINAYTWSKRESMGEAEGDPYTRYPNKDYKVYINGNEVLDTGNMAEATGGDLGGAVYVSEFGNLRPYLDNLVSLGSYYEEGDGIAAWRHVVTYDTIQISDRREKESIQDMDKRYVDFIMSLRPKKYKYRKTREEEYRTGFIAQEVEDVLDDVGLRNKDFGGLKKKPIVMDGQVVDYGYGLNYDDFVAALVLTVQDLQKQINDLKGELKNGIRSFKN